MAEDKKPAGTKWDGISRVSNDLYRKNFEEIFKKGIVGKDTTLQDVRDLLDETQERTDDRGPNDLEKVIDNLKRKIKRLER